MLLAGIIIAPALRLIFILAAPRLIENFSWAYLSGAWLRAISQVRVKAPAMTTSTARRQSR